MSHALGDAGASFLVGQLADVFKGDESTNYSDFFGLQVNSTIRWTVLENDITYGK
jgi:hypothetical protein